MALLVDLKKHMSFDKDFTCNCHNCGKLISVKDNNNNSNSKLIRFKCMGGGILCMTCLFKLHLELNDIFEDTPIGLESFWQIDRY